VWVGLALDFNRGIPTPLLLNVSLIFSALRIKLGECVTLVVWCDIESWLSLLTTSDEGSLNDGIIGSSVDTGRSEEELSAGLETVEETT
jgi:hypothetical protein